ncbi:MAG: DUF5615 family PIN-like protein [Verrucomicrobia bacterium]|nr:DUF5615 family PIN-like protein [Verrucomicrobiota bacterium]
MASLFADEGFPLPVVQELRRLGHDVVTTHEIGKANQRWPDPEVFAWANSGGRAILTINRRHFRRFHETQPDHAGLILCTADADFVGQARRIHEAIASVESLKGLRIRIVRPG